MGTSICFSLWGQLVFGLTVKREFFPRKRKNRGNEGLGKDYKKLMTRGWAYGLKTRFYFDFMFSLTGNNNDKNIDRKPNPKESCYSGFLGCSSVFIYEICKENLGCVYN